MQDIIDFSNDGIKLTYLPEEVVIAPDDYMLPITPVESEFLKHVVTGSVRILTTLINPSELPEHDFETLTIVNTTDQNVDLED